MNNLVKVLKNIFPGMENRLRFSTGAPVWVVIDMGEGEIRKVLMTQHAIGLFRNQHTWTER